MTARQRLLDIWHANRAFPLLIGLLALLTLAVYLWLVYQVNPRLERLERRYIELQGQARHVRQLEADRESPTNLYQKRLADLSRFLEMVPPQKEFTRLIADIFGLADEAGLSIVSVNYSPKELEDQNLLEYGLAFAVKGDYAQLKKFIYLLEKSQRLIAIDSLTLSGTQNKESDESEVALQLKLTTYFQAGVL